MTPRSPSSTKSAPETASASFASSPPPAGYHWRAASAHDIPAIEQIQVVANGGTLHPRERMNFDCLVKSSHGRRVSTLCAIDTHGQVIAFSSAAIYAVESEWRGDLECLVHPDRRDHGLEAFLLDWAESKAHELLTDMSSERQAVLRIAFTDRRQDSLSLYASRGFSRTLAVDIMQNDLRTVPALTVPDGCFLQPWSDIWIPSVHQMYHATFSARPRFRDWSEETLRRILIETSEFRSDLSRVILRGAEPVGYVVCWIDPAIPGSTGRRAAFIAQAGVHPAAQNLGLGSCLLIAALHAIRANGFDEASSEIEVDNPGSRRLAERLGFTRAARLQVYSRLVPLR